MFKFNRTYFIFAVLLFITEVIIAMYVRDAIIRPYGGDFLVVILIYCAVRSCINISVTAAAIGTLLFAYGIEILQYFHIVNLLGLQDSKIASIVIGTGFEWMDLLMYTAGIVLVWLIEIKVLNKQQWNSL